MAKGKHGLTCIQHRRRVRISTVSLYDTAAVNAVITRLWSMAENEWESRKPVHMLHLDKTPHAVQTHSYLSQNSTYSLVRQNYKRCWNRPLQNFQEDQNYFNLQRITKHKGEITQQNNAGILFIFRELWNNIKMEIYQWNNGMGRKHV